jgi:hypothetical protein
LNDLPDPQKGTDHSDVLRLPLRVISFTKSTEWLDGKTTAFSVRLT